MSPEPNKSIEELLQASAQARRAQFGDGEAKMPNPMRARLHEEISRASRVEEAPVRTSWLAAYWPRLVTGAAVAALVIGFPLLWWRAGEVGDAARYAINEPPAAVVDSATAPAAAGRADTAMADRLAEAQESAKANQAQEESARTTATMQPAAPAAAPLPAQPETTSEIAGAGVVAEAKPKTGEFANVRQQFTQTPAGVASRGNARASAAAVEVLNTFQIEQEGNTIRVIDADGSTYTGTVQLVARSGADPAESSMARKEQSLTAEAPASRRPRSAALQRAKDGAQSEFTFRATGYNSSLKKEVVFEGNYIAPAAAAPAELSQRSGARADEEDSAARVIGTARIPGEAAVPVDAAARGAVSR
ncbi:MAG: hypothetical protein H0V56_03540 [Chthoniobacterales bacterium]|nr:hypothetical protein [Chthoniobacterales bacterium]